MRYSDKAEWLRSGWARSDSLLRRVYKEFGPKEIHDGKFRPVPTHKFAAMTTKQTGAWDGMSKDHRLLMLKVARHLEK